MCKYCQIVISWLGGGFMCRPCWRKRNHNKKKDR